MTTNQSGIIAKISLLAGLLAVVSGCVTGIVQKPDLSRLSYDEKGVLRYAGQPAEVRYVLPWYQDIWPDSGPEWGFTLITFGAGVGIGAALGGDGGGNDNGGGESTTPPPAAPTPKPPSSGGGGGNGDETPF